MSISIKRLFGKSSEAASATPIVHTDTAVIEEIKCSDALPDKCWVCITAKPRKEFFGFAHLLVPKETAETLRINQNVKVSIEIDNTFHN